MNIVYCDALVIGGGMAGLRAAVEAKNKGLSTIVLSLVPVKRSHSAAAQGGMQASLGNSKMGRGDNEDVHFADTVKGSDWGCDQKVARMFVTTSPKAIRQLAGWGVPWTRIAKGPREVVMNAKRTTIVEDDETHGYIQSRDFGGTKKWRTCFTSDATGHTMLYGIANEAMKRDIDIRDRKEAISLIVENNQCYGAIVRDLITGELAAYVAKGTLIATGGYGRTYKQTTNAVICEGIGAAIALETGVARLGNMEAVQFHPTALVPTGILMTEGCRGDGGLLRDVDGHRFMPDYEPEKKELASRDVVSRRMMEHIRKGKGVKSPYGDHLWLDISILGREHIEKNLRDVQDISRVFNGIDPADEGAKGWIPVVPMQHYSMGGIRVKPTGESQTLKGLFSCGEAACWDLHGFNRLGGNSVAETVVSGMIIGDYFANHCMNTEIDINTKSVENVLEKQINYIDSLIEAEGKYSIVDIKNEMKEIMWDNVGIFRNEEALVEAVDRLEGLYKKSHDISIKSKSLVGNPELAEAYRVPKMIKVALCIAMGARDRKESRGAHYREDFCISGVGSSNKHGTASWKEGDTLPTIEYEDLDITKMEMAPGFRGYGRKGMIVENPQSIARQEEIDKTREQMEADGKDRFEIQEALMPFELQPYYKVKNERFGE